MTTPDGRAELIRLIVYLDQEISQVSKPLTQRREEARKLLKDAMTEADVSESIDEESGYRALIRQTASDEYVADKLLPLLRPEQRAAIVGLEKHQPGGLEIV